MCFEKPFIGLRGCIDVANSGYFINDLPGINLKTISSLADDETLRGKALFERCEKNAIEAVKRDFLNLIQSKYTFNDIVSEEKSFGNYGDWVDVGEKCIGIDIQVCNKEDIIVDLSFLSFFCNTSFTTSINIANNLTETANLTRIINAGENILRNLALNAGDNLLVRLAFPTGAQIKKIENCACDCNPTACYCSECATIKFYSYFIGGGIEAELDYVPFNFKVLCRNNYDNIFCMYERDLAQAVWYQTGIQLMLELLTTKEINPIVTNQIEDAEKLLALWGGSDQTLNNSTANNLYSKNGEYYKSLNAAVLKASNYICKSNLKTESNIPYLIASI